MWTISETTLFTFCSNKQTPDFQQETKEVKRHKSQLQQEKDLSFSKLVFPLRLT